MRIRLATALAALGLLLALAWPASGTVRARFCGEIKVPDPSGGAVNLYYNYVTHGTVTCRRANQVMRAFLIRDERISPWACFRGHGSQRWAAACSRKGGAVTRSYPVHEI